VVSEEIFKYVLSIVSNILRHKEHHMGEKEYG
jgi:hypothetical protein